MTFAVALAAGVTAQSLARHLRIPGIVLLLATGAILGPELLGWVQPQSLGHGLFELVHLAVAVILFEGGLNLELAQLRRQEKAIRRLISVGATITFLGATGIVLALLGWNWEQALLFGSLVVVTGPTVVTPLLRDLRLRPKIRTVVEAEGVLIDPVGALLAALVLQIVLTPAAETLTSELLGLGSRLAVGGGLGLAAGFLLGNLLRIQSWIPHGLENIFSLAVVVLLFQGCEQLLSQSGVLAVTIAGIVVGNIPNRVTKELREFKDQLTLLLVGLLFVLLAADVRFQDVWNLGWGGIGVVVLLILLIRPLAVAVSVLGSPLERNERLFIAWIAPRGIVAAAIASATATAMEEQNLAGSTELRALVFLTIAGTVLLAGFTALPVANLLRVRLPARDRIAILGVQGVGFLLGELLRKRGNSVIFFDSDPQRCRRAEKAGFPVVFGDALEERTLLRGQLDLVQAAVGLTPNTHLNSLFVQRSQELFRVPEAFVSLYHLDAGSPPEYLQEKKVKMLFNRPLDVGRWDVRERHGKTILQRFSRIAAHKPESDAGAEKNKQARFGKGEPYLVLLIDREEQSYLMHHELELEENDRAWIAIYEPERGHALELLHNRGWQPIEGEELIFPES